MNKPIKEKVPNENIFKTFIKTKIAKKGKQLKNKYPPISEVINGKPRILKIKKIYELKENLKDYYLIIVKNYFSEPKIRYFLATKLASLSSDLLANIAKDVVPNNKQFKLIQFCIHPKSFRTNLLILNELLSNEEFLISVKLLKKIRVKFKKKISMLKNLIQNE